VWREYPASGSTLTRTLTRTRDTKKLIVSKRARGAVTLRVAPVRENSSIFCMRLVSNNKTSPMAE
jgi:hypothetical protein